MGNHTIGSIVTNLATSSRKGISWKDNHRVVTACHPCLVSETGYEESHGGGGGSTNQQLGIGTRSLPLGRV